MFRFWFFLFSTSLIFAQIKINGTLVDPNEKPIAYATLRLHSLADSTKKQNTLSDKQGNFVLSVDFKGPYILTINHMGVSLYKKTLSIEQNQNLGKLTLENAINLEPIAISKEKKIVEQKIDRLVFNVENSISAKNGSVWEALSKTPGVIIMQNQINIIGKGVNASNRRQACTSSC